MTILPALLAAAALGAPLGAVQRVFSDPVSNRAWRIDAVSALGGRISDATGTLVEKADVEYLTRINEGLQEILDAGSNAFRRAEAEFRAALAANPPGPSTFISMAIPPHSDRSPDGRNAYGLIVKEGETVDWYLSRPFLMQPNVVAQDIYVDVSGATRTNYTACSWADYFADATNAPAPHVVSPWGRVVRMNDAELPADAKEGTAGGYPVVIRDPHLHFGHPEHGMDWGGMLVDVVGGDGVVRHTVTGIYTGRVNGVRFEVKLVRGGFTSRTVLGE